MPELQLISASGTAQRRLLEETVKELRKKGYEMSARQDGGEWQALLSENMSGGLFDVNRFVVIDNAELLKDMPESFGTMVEAGAPVVIVLVYETDPSKYIPKEIFKKCKLIKPAPYPRWPRERQQWVNNLARSMNLNLAADASALLVELTEDPEEIRGQLQTLKAFKGDKIVGTPDVEEFCLDDGSKDLLRLLDGICNGENAAVMKTLEAMRKNSQSGDLIRLVTSLQNRFRLAMYGGIFPQASALFKNALGARDYAWRLAQSAVKRYGRGRIFKFVVSLIKLNIGEKSGTSAGWQELQTIILELFS